MAAPIYTAADYLRALQSLLPTGRVWPQDPDATLTAVLTGLAGTYAREHARSNALLVDSFPATTYELLPEWEETLGLPDPCVGPQTTVQARRAQVLARFIASGGQSVPFVVAYAAALGFTITVTQFAPARVGQSRVGQPLCGEAWAWAWQLNAPLDTVTASRVGAAAVGEPLRSWGNTALECEIRKIAPAHTDVLFSYT